MLWPSFSDTMTTATGAVPRGQRQFEALMVRPRRAFHGPAGATRRFLSYARPTVAHESLGRVHAAVEAVRLLGFLDPGANQDGSWQLLPNA